MKIFKVLIVLMLIAKAQLYSLEPIDKNNQEKIVKYDICDFFLDSKSILSYDYMFGSGINTASIFIADVRQPCINYEYIFDNYGRVINKKTSHIYTGITSIRKYQYNNSGQLIQVNEKRDEFEKTLYLAYNVKGGLSEIIEEISPGKDDEYFKNYDFIKYKINERGNIFEVRAGKSFLGIYSSIILLKTYDYDESNRLKSVRDYINPDNSKIIRYDEFVKRN